MKAKLRKEISEKRKQLNSAVKTEWDDKILEKLKDLFSETERQRRPEAVYCYISVRNEAGTERFIDWLLQQKIHVAVPRVQGKEMFFYYIESLEDLIRGTFGIPEPAPHCLPAENITAPVIVPGVAFSGKFQRVGYGAGYYDRFFAAEPEHRKIAVCYEFQMYDEVPEEPFDVLMDLIITEEKIIRR